MGMTMTQKILARAAGMESVKAGDLIMAELDLVLGNDITSPVAIHEIEKMKVDGWIEEIISGTKAYSKRQLGVLLKQVEKDDVIICAELSRLGRNLFMIMEILNICMTKECKVWTIKDNYRLGEDIQSKVLAFAFGLSAEIERNLISQRTKEALARKKAEGVVLGRPKGRKSAPEKYKLHGKQILISELLAANVSKRKIAKICIVDRNTLDRYIHSFLAVNK